MSVASVVQPGLRRRTSIKTLALIAVLGAAVVTAPRGGRHASTPAPPRCSHGGVPTPAVTVAPAPAPAPAAGPTSDRDPCPAALAAWAAVRNLPDVPSGTTAYERVRLRNQAIEACRAPRQP